MQVAAACRHEFGASSPHDTAGRVRAEQVGARVGADCGVAGQNNVAATGEDLRLPTSGRTDGNGCIDRSPGKRIGIHIGAPDHRYERGCAGIHRGKTAGCIERIARWIAIVVIGCGHEQIAADIDGSIGIRTDQGLFAAHHHQIAGEGVGPRNAGGVGADGEQIAGRIQAANFERKRRVIDGGTPVEHRIRAEPVFAAIHRAPADFVIGRQDNVAIDHARRSGRLEPQIAAEQHVDRRSAGAGTGNPVNHMIVARAGAGRAAGDAGMDDRINRTRAGWQRNVEQAAIMAEIYGPGCDIHRRPVDPNLAPHRDARRGEDDETALWLGQKIAALGDFDARTILPGQQ